MFGESDSESPRVPSPWDSLISAPPSPPEHNGTQGIPKLAPEAEEGNVEYKLQLLSPSPARFARLVTQLKWRLLEGGGQAYYELGVADSGTLVGLLREQLEESLETLEMMAGEIGASVIVVKEIEVSPEISSIAECQLEIWDGKRSARRKDMLRMMKRGDKSPVTSATETETQLSNTDVTDTEVTTCYSPVASPSSLPGVSNLPHLKLPPTPVPFDPVLALFNMDFGEDHADYADNETVHDDVSTESVAEFLVGLEISSVYKPRPMKKRATHITHSEHPKKRSKDSYPPSKSTHVTCQTANTIVQSNSETLLQAIRATPSFRRDRRDKLREPRVDTLLTHVSTCHSTESPTDPADLHINPPFSTNEPSLSTLDLLPTAIVDPPPTDISGITTTASRMPRLIVEALVVRKLSLDEAFLDFEGFSLQ